MTGVLVSVFFAVVAISYFGIGRLRQFVLARSILDIPNDRSSHTVPTPRGGGVLIVTLVLCGLIIYFAARGSTELAPLLAYGVAGGAIAIISWVDDMNTLSTRVRFAVHMIAALLVLTVVGAWDTVSLPLIGTLQLGWFGAIMAFVWLVGLTNAFNFMDGIDGISGSQALLAGLGWLIVGWQLGVELIAVWGLLIAASSIGFLLHNWHPATIFMGDVGSAFLGFTFATLPLFFNQLASTDVSAQKSFLLGVLMLWPFVIDAFSTFVKRLLRGENVLAAHREHLYQRLIILGQSHGRVSTLYGLLALTGVMLSLWWISAETDLALITIWLLLIVFLFGYVTYVEHTVE